MMGGKRQNRDTVSCRGSKSEVGFVVNWRMPKSPLREFLTGDEVRTEISQAREKWCPWKYGYN